MSVVDCMADGCVIDRIPERFNECYRAMANRAAPFWGSSTNEVRSIEIKKSFVKGKLSTVREVINFGSINGKQI